MLKPFCHPEAPAEGSVIKFKETLRFAQNDIKTADLCGANNQCSVSL